MKPSIPKGTRDFTPDQVNKRDFIFSVIRKQFVTFGFQPIETPAMEALETLTGKYGEEGDRLLFKVLNNGDYLEKADADALANRDSNKLTRSISKRGLRYDLTVPFARFVVMNQGSIPMPFKRYQIQPVWRADRPQRGRYQEFFQCDADVVGSDSLMFEAELLQLYDRVFTDLGIRVSIQLNNRKILAGLATYAGIPDRMMEMTIAIDKLDKIGIEGVSDEMRQRNIPEEAIEKIKTVLGITTLDGLRKQLGEVEEARKGIEELEQIFHYTPLDTLSNPVNFDITLARGLNYYTGCIFEVKALDVSMGSIGGGGRYDNLTGVFGLNGVSGVGISFGAERIYDVMEELKRFPPDTSPKPQIIFMAFDAPTHAYAFRALTRVRQAGIIAELYPTPGKLNKQMKYANDRKAAYVVLVGDTEMNTGMLALKNMETGEQKACQLDEIIAFFQGNIDTLDPKPDTDA